MGNRSYGKGHHDGYAKGFQAGARRSNWQTWAATGIAAAIIVTSQTLKDRRNARKTGSASA